jgi:hypothetical protein
MSCEKGLSPEVTIIPPVGLDDLFGSLFKAPTGALFEALDGRRGRPVYMFPTYESNSYLKRTSKTVAIAVGCLVLGILTLMVGPITNPCFVLGLAIFLALMGIVLLNHGGRQALVVYEDGIRFAGMELKPVNFYSLDVYPQVSDLYHGNPKGGFDIDVKPFYEFLFTLDVGDRMMEASIDLICSERDVERHLGDIRQHMSGMRMYFHRGMGPDTGPIARTALRAIKDPKDFFKIRLP